MGGLSGQEQRVDGGFGVEVVYGYEVLGAVYDDGGGVGCRVCDVGCEAIASEEGS